jgi:signal transduction histidine kinase
MPSGGTFADLLRTRSSEVLARWKERVVGTLTPVGTRPPEILDGLPGFLEHVASDVAAGIERPAAPSPSATDHGAQRFHAGFSVGAVIREYQVLQECILDVASENGIELAIDDVRCVACRISAAIAEAVEEFTRERDAAINRERNQHLGFIAHELRNHVSTARVAIELQRRQMPDPPAAIERAHRALNQLQRLIDETVLDVRLGTLSGGMAELRLELLDLRELAAEVAAEVADDATLKDVRLLLEEGAAVEVEADRILMRSVVDNLIRNAVKFTGPGQAVTIRVRATDDRAGLSVEDRCGGLPENRTEELFLPFIQKGADRSGYGLGLAIAKRAAEAHLGTIQARNLPGIGCIFSIDVPLRQAIRSE